MIDRFITFKEPHIIEDSDEKKGGTIFRSHVVMTDGRHVLISDAKHGSGFYEIDETLAFLCDENGNVSDWSEVCGGRFARTEEIVTLLNQGSL
jgi:hypothetical protein